MVKLMVAETTPRRSKPERTSPAVSVWRCEPLQALPHRRPKLLDSRQVRELSALISLVVYLVPISVHLKQAAACRGDFDCDVRAALREDFVGHPGHYAMMASRHAVDDLYLYLAFSGHGLPPLVVALSFMLSQCLAQRTAYQLSGLEANIGCNRCQNPLWIAASDVRSGASAVPAWRGPLD